MQLQRQKSSSQPLYPPVMDYCLVRIAAEKELTTTTQIENRQ